MMPDYSEILIAVAKTNRQLTDHLNARDIVTARWLADELMFQARQLQLLLREGE
jgi:hypothetical protein